MPTFDFANTIRQVVARSLATLTSPFTVISALSAGIVYFIGQYSTIFNIITNFLQSPSVSSIFSVSDDTSLKALVCYCLSFDTLFYTLSILGQILLDIITILSVCVFSTLTYYGVSIAYRSLRISLQSWAH